MSFFLKVMLNMCFHIDLQKHLIVFLKTKTHAHTFISNIILRKFPLYVNCILKGWCYHILLHHRCRITKKAFMLQKLFHKPQECITQTGHMSFNTGFVCQEACTACSWQNCWTFVAPCCSVQKIQRYNGTEVWVSDICTKQKWVSILDLNFFE